MTKNTKTQKMQKTKMSVFVQNHKKKKGMEIFAFCIITFEPIKVSFLKDVRVVSKKWLKMVIKLTFFSHKFDTSPSRLS